MFAEHIVELFPAMLFYQVNLFNLFIVYETKDLINSKAWEECKILWQCWETGMLFLSYHKLCSSGSDH